MRLSIVLSLFALCACSSSQATTGGKDAGPTDASGAPADAGDAGASTYTDPEMWLCGAGAPHDYCLDPQTVTTIHPDLTQTTATLDAATAPGLDCFYVYPSVDGTSPPGNEADFTNLPNILDPVREQAAPFSQVCKVYAPLYHQATFKSYFDPNATQYLEAAYADVAAAFSEYMQTFNQGRDFVLVGHSQGSHMLRRLIQRKVESDASVAKHLVVALLGGSFGDVTVPKGQTVGGSFVSTPLCSQNAQRGCVITWNSFAKGYEPTAAYGAGVFAVPAGQDIGCTNPAALAGGKAALSGSTFFTQFQDPNLAPPQSTGVSTTFAALGGFYNGQCLPSVGGFSFFEIDLEGAAGDQRTNPIPFDDAYYSPSNSLGSGVGLGLHLLDFGFPMQELLAAVRGRS